MQDADASDTATIQQTLPEAAEQLEAVAAVTVSVAVIEVVVADKGYHSRTMVRGLETLAIRTSSANPIADHSRGPTKNPNGTRSTRIDVRSGATAGHDSSGNAGNCSNDHAPASMKLVGSEVCMCVGTRTLKRVLVHAGAFNLGLWMRMRFGVGTRVASRDV